MLEQKFSGAGGESQWHKDDWSWRRTIPRIVFYDLLSSRRASFQYPRAAKRRIPLSLPLPSSFSLSLSLSFLPSPASSSQISLPFLSTYLPCRSTSPYTLLPLPVSFLLPFSSLTATHLPRLALSSPNGRAASILTTALRIYFGAPCASTDSRDRERIVYGISSVFL